MANHRTNTKAAPNPKGRPRKTEVTIREIAALDAPEIRLLRAKALGFEIVETPIPNTTRAKYRRIESIFDQCKRHKWITAEQHRAAEILSAHFAKANMMPRTTMSWSAFVDNGQGNACCDGTEKRDEATKKFRNAITSIHEESRDQFLGWFMSAQADDVSVHDLGALFTPAKHKEARKALGIFVLQGVLKGLAIHYGVTSEKNTTRRRKAA